jgi:hypothetical protein
MSVRSASLKNDQKLSRHLSASLNVGRPSVSHQSGVQNVYKLPDIVDDNERKMLNSRASYNKNLEPIFENDVTAIRLAEPAGKLVE